MNFDKYTQKSLEAVQSAQKIAAQYGNQTLMPEHLFSALLGQDGGLAPELMNKCGANPQMLQQEVTALISRFPKVSGATADRVYASQGLTRVFAEAESLAGKMQDEYTSVEHLLYGILATADGELK